MQYSETLTGKDYQRMIAAAYRAFMREHEYINSLNVFPVPDGDTGTNMLLTLGAVARAVAEAPSSGIGAISKRAADSAIMGARGNSGVILSQIFRGIARGLAGKDQATSAEVGKAFQYGILYAYRAVSRPVEGTILTVAKGIAKGARRAVREGVPFVDILTEALQAGRQELKRTPELLPALKNAGVVDAGGQGLITFLNGCLEGLTGDFSGPEANIDRELSVIANDKQLEIAHPYCTEFIVKDCSIDDKEARRLLEPMGESMVLAEGDNVLKVHLHTAHPGSVLECALTWGTLHNIKIDNMSDQQRPEAPQPRARKSIAIMSVVVGDGLADIMRNLGADIIISGGQTMNPPVEDFISAVHEEAADHYIILPNNKNIILAAMQVKKLLGDRVEIVSTRSVPQGLAALMAFDADASLTENVSRMEERSAAVREASVTVAVRDSVVDGREVPSGKFIGLFDGQVKVDADDLAIALSAVAAELITPSTEIISLYYGSDVTSEQAQQLADNLAAAYSQAAVELYYGGQPHYHLLVSIE